MTVTLFEQQVSLLRYLQHKNREKQVNYNGALNQLKR